MFSRILLEIRLSPSELVYVLVTKPFLFSKFSTIISYNTSQLREFKKICNSGTDILVLGNVINIHPIRERFTNGRTEGFVSEETII